MQTNSLSQIEYERGFRAGAASVRTAPWIVIDWSSLTGGILNIIGFAALLYIASFYGELRGMKNDNRLSVVFSDGTAIPKKTDAAVIRGTHGTTVTMKGQ